MVRDQLAGCDDERVIAAMAALPRHWFVDPGARADAYGDHAMAIGSGQTISQPKVVAYMLAQLQVTPGCHVLDVGSGSGYAAALLAHLAGSQGFVDAVERQSALVEASRAVLAQLAESLDIAPIVLHFDDGSRGLSERGPFDRIHVGCGGEQVPAELLAALAPGGRMIIPIGPDGEQELRLITRDADGTVHTQHLWPVRFVPLLPGRA